MCFLFRCVESKLGEDECVEKKKKRKKRIKDLANAEQETDNNTEKKIAYHSSVLVTGAFTVGKFNRAACFQRFLFLPFWPI